MADAGLPDFYRGDTKKYRIVIREKQVHPSDPLVPISVDGGTLTFTIKKKEKDEDYLLQEVVLAVEPIPATPAGIIEITIPKEKTEELAPGKVFYDFEFKNAAGEVTTILAGYLTVLYDITTP